MQRLEILFSNRPLTKALWMSVDVLLINIAFMLAYWLRYSVQLFRAVDPAFNVPYTVYWPFVMLFTALLIGVYRHQGLYRARRQVSWFEEFYALLNGTATGAIITIVIVFLYQPSFYSRLIFLYAALFSVVLLSGGRVLKLWLFRALRHHGIGIKRLLIVGAGEIARTVMRTIVAHPDLGFRIIGFLDDDPEKQVTNIGPFKAFGRLENLDPVLRNEQIDEVIITLPWQYHHKILSIMVHCQRQHIRARIVPDLFQLTINHMHIIDLAGIPMIGTREVSISGLNQVVKRGLDLVLGTLLFILASPLMGLIALIIKMESAGPVIFRQQRIGKNGEPFTMYKFRSMIADAEERKYMLQELNEAQGPLFKIKEDPRITSLGKWLRKFSMDEWPQLYNVIRGDMSLIGPRPPLPDEVAQYQEWHMRRLEVAPGITGLGQVSGRSELSFDEMALLDIYYIENWSLLMDTQILLRTIPRVILGSGAY